MDTSYELTLDADARNGASLRDGVGGEEKATDVNKMLDCNNVKSFWVSWARGNIQVGYGKIRPCNLLLSVKFITQFCCSCCCCVFFVFCFTIHLFYIV